MKKISFAAFAGLFCICTSCNHDGVNTSYNKENSQQQQNIAASDVVNKAFEKGDVSGIDSVVADDFLDHTDRGDKKGRDSLKAMVKFYYANFKNMKTEKIREVADGDYVWSWMHYSGTTDGSMGIPKGPYDMRGVELSKFKDGKAVEHWGFMDMQDMMKLMPQADMSNMKMDTTKAK